MKKVISIILLLLLIPNICMGYEKLNSDKKANIRINEIKSTKNTNIQSRVGKTYYLSADGNDSNDGLTEETAWKTIEKLNSECDKRRIKSTDTILFRRGDIFRGHIILRENDIMLGSYGNENLAKPEICVSPFDGTKVGEWNQVDTNIWEYTVDGENPFIEDVGTMWFYSENGEISYAQKILTLEDFDETDLDLKTILHNDLEFYQTGHATYSDAKAEALYLYSIGNPKERFEEIEFCIAKCGIRMWNLTDVFVDNLTVKYAGVHGIAAGTVANLEVTNCEFAYIGGAIQKYETSKVVRYGNAIEVYGSVAEKNGYKVKNGYIIRNNYVHDIYDAGLTFQLTTEEASQIENVIFDNNVIERCQYSVEYWNNCTSAEEEGQGNTYINNFEITNNIMRWAGFGVSQTRLDKNQSAHIKTWKHNQDNLVKGKYIIENNIFDNSSEHIFYIYAVNEASLPKVKNNTFYNSEESSFGYMYFDKKVIIPYNIENLESNYPENSFYNLSIKIPKGDVDLNDEITANDLALLKLHLIKKEKITSEESLEAADIDQDEEITINDLAKLKLMLKKKPH